MSDAYSAAADYFLGDRGPEHRARRALLEECPDPLKLALKFDPQKRSSPAMEYVSQVWRRVLTTPDARAVISTPAQQGKTELAKAAATWALIDDPNRRIVYVSFSHKLARDAVRDIRGMIEAHGEPLGLRLDEAHRDAADFGLAGFKGRCLAASPSSRLTGSPADVMIIDDIHAGEAEANSPAILSATSTWWESTARLRMGPGAPAVAIGTRFSTSDLISRFIAEGWERVNVPALHDGKAFDSVAEVPGARTEDGWLITTRNTSPDAWRLIRRESTERAFQTTAQGSPTVPQGDVFKAAWFDGGRVTNPDHVPELRTKVIAVDPAETGSASGDEAGILVGGVAASGDIYIVADLSGRLSQAAWARRICVGLLRHGCHRVLAERTLGMNSAVGDAFAILRRQAMALDRYATVDRAVAALAIAGDEQAADEGQVAEIVDLVEDALSLPSTGPRVVTVTPRASKQVRAEAITSLFELGRAHLVGSLPFLEHECLTWRPSIGRSPNRIDVLAHLVSHLDGGAARGGHRIHSAAGTGAGPRQWPSATAPTSTAAAAPKLVRRGRVMRMPSVVGRSWGR